MRRFVHFRYSVDLFRSELKVGRDPAGERPAGRHPGARRRRASDSFRTYLLLPRCYLPGRQRCTTVDER